MSKKDSDLFLRKAEMIYSCTSHPLKNKADPDYGRRVAEGLGLNILAIERLAKMSQEERAQATARKA